MNGERLLSAIGSIGDSFINSASEENVCRIFRARRFRLIRGLTAAACACAVISFTIPAIINGRPSVNVTIPESSVEVSDSSAEVSDSSAEASGSAAVSEALQESETTDVSAEISEAASQGGDPASADTQVSDEEPPSDMSEAFQVSDPTFGEVTSGEEYPEFTDEVRLGGWIFSLYSREGDENAVLKVNWPSQAGTLYITVYPSETEYIEYTPCFSQEEGKAAVTEHTIAGITAESYITITVVTGSGETIGTVTVYPTIHR